MQFTFYTILNCPLIFHLPYEPNCGLIYVGQSYSSVGHQYTRVGQTINLSFTISLWSDRMSGGFLSTSDNFTNESIRKFQICIAKYLRGNFFQCHVFAMKSVQNLKSFWRSSQNYFVLALFSSLYSYQPF